MRLSMIALALLSAIVPAIAQEEVAIVYVPLPAAAYSSLLLVRSSADGSAHDVFRLMHGGCLTGPLYFLDDKGGKLFELVTGAEYPAGCRSRKD
jgi:hypothetical protein